MKKIEILYKDHQLLIINKPSGIAIQSTDNDQLSAIEIMEKKTGGPLFITHRLDQVTSGTCIFAKSKRTCAAINQSLQSGIVEKSYLAVVRTGIAKQEDSLEMKLVHNQKARKAFLNPKGKLAKLDYSLLFSSDRYDLLQVKILEGRFHQIRCMLAEEGMPIKGDVKYGARRSNKDRSIHLHAHTLAFPHPKTKEILHFSAPLPSENLWQFFAEQMESGQ